MVLFIPRAKSTSDYAFEALGQGLRAGVNELQQQAKEQKETKALKEAGLPTSLMNLPPEARAAAFKSAFAQEKPLNPLQQAKLDALNQQTALFEQMFPQFKKPSFQQQISEQPQNIPEEAGMPQQEIPELPNVDKNFLKQMPEDQLNYLSSFAGQPGTQGILGTVAQNEIDRRKEDIAKQHKFFSEERAYHTAQAAKEDEKANILRESIPKKEMALNFARNAVMTGDVGYFSPDKLADITGVDLFRTAKGAQLITAGKENLLSNLSRVSARAQNLWMEQRMSSMFPKIGQSEEANLTTQEMIEAEVALDKAYLNAFDKETEKDEKELGYGKKDRSKRAHEAIKPLENQIMRRASFRMKELEEQEKGLDKLKNEVGKNVPKGTPLTLKMGNLYIKKFGEKNAKKIAEANGYYIPTSEELDIFLQSPEEFRELL